MLHRTLSFVLGPCAPITHLVAHARTRTCPRPCRVEADLAKVEQQIYDLETHYFEETNGYDVVHGWAGFTAYVFGLSWERVCTRHARTTLATSRQLVPLPVQCGVVWVVSPPPWALGNCRARSDLLAHVHTGTPTCTTSSLRPLHACAGHLPTRSRWRCTPTRACSPSLPSRRRWANDRGLSPCAPPPRSPPASRPQGTPRRNSTNAPTTQLQQGRQHRLRRQARPIACASTASSKAAAAIPWRTARASAYTADHGGTHSDAAARGFGAWRGV
jgi:hypothetical protein